jgi:cysteine-rich repeat protein
MKFARWLHTTIRVFSFFLILLHFFWIEALAQEIPSTTPEASVVMQPISSADTSTEISQDPIAEATNIMVDASQSTEELENENPQTQQEQSVEFSSEISSDSGSAQTITETIYEFEPTDISLSWEFSEYIPEAATGDLATQINELLNATLEQFNQQLAGLYDITNYGEVTIMLPKNVTISSLEDPIDVTILEPEIQANNQEAEEEQLLTIYTPQWSDSGELVEDIYEYTPLDASGQVESMSAESEVVLNSGTQENNWDSEIINNPQYTENVQSYNYIEGITTGNLNFQLIEYSGLDNTKTIQSFEFGVHGEDVLFSSPVRIEINLTEEQMQYQSFELQVKHESDSNYNTVWLSINPDTLCDTDGNATLPGTHIIPIQDKITFYTCRASDFLLLAQLDPVETNTGDLMACEAPIIWTNTTQFISTNTGLTLTNPNDPTFATNKDHFYQGANSTEFTEDARVYFTVSDSPFTIGFSTGITENYHSGKNMRFAVYFSETGILQTQQYGELLATPGTYTSGDNFYFLLTGNRLELYTLGGDWITSWPNELSYPVYLDVHYPISLRDELSETRITNAKFANMSCLMGLNICGDALVWPEEECDLGSKNGSGGLCMMDCTFNPRMKKEEVVKISEDIQITIPENTEISRIVQNKDTQVTIYEGNTETNHRGYKTYSPIDDGVTVSDGEEKLYEYVPQSMIQETNLQAQDLILEEYKVEEIKDSIQLEDVENFSWEVAKMFEFGEVGEDLIFSKPVKIEVKVEPNSAGPFGFNLYTKHASDDKFNTVWLSTDPESLCDAQGNPTLPGNTLKPIDGKITFYSCRASQYIFVEADCKTASIGVDGVECAALLDFYNSTNGSGWANTGKWLENTGAHLWYGLSVSGGHVIGISLGANKLSWTFNDSLKDLTMIQNFDVHRGTAPNENTITWPLPSSRSTWTQIIDFNAGGLQINGNLPSSRSTWTNVKNFVANINQITWPLPSSRSTWTKIEYFYIADNLLTGTLPSSRSTWTKIKRFNIWSNNFTGELPSSRSDRENIEYFYSYFTTNINGTLPSSYSNWKKIKVFDVFSNKISGTLPSSRSTWTGIQSFNASINKLTGTLPSSRSTWNKIGWFAVHSNQLTGTLPSSRSAWTGMQFFSVSSNNFNGRVPASRSTWSAISTFWISCNYMDRERSGYKAFPLPSPISSTSPTLWVNQSDIVAPIIGSLSSPAKWSVDTGFDLGTFTIDENSYAVNGSNQGLKINLSGSAGCSGLLLQDKVGWNTSGGRITINSGVVDLHIGMLTGVATGTYNCTLVVEDRGAQNGGSCGLINQMNTSNSIEFSFTYVKPPIDGACGALYSWNIYDFNNSWDSLSGGTIGLCATGTLTGFTYNTGTHQWSWSCLGQYGGSGASCGAQELYCGDGVGVYISTLISQNSSGIIWDSSSSYFDMSSDGRYVAFESFATNLVAGDTNGVADIFVYDRQTDTMQNITSIGNNSSRNPSISADGRYIAFQSLASNLVAGDTNGKQDTFVYDRQTDTMQNITSIGNDNSWGPAISSDGRYVTFSSQASNLVAGDTNGVADIFVYDKQTDTTTNITISGNNNSYFSAISSDGRYVTFSSQASNLVAGDTNGKQDTFVYDRQTDTMQNITSIGNDNSWGPAISSDGRYVTFSSQASNLVAGDTNGVADIFVYDKQTDTTTNITISGNDDSYVPVISADGRYVAYRSIGVVAIYDRQLNNTRVVAYNVGGDVDDVAISADGMYVAYNNEWQVYMAWDQSEQCDDGNANNDDACSNSCTLNTPSCPAFNFTIAPTTGTVPRPVTGTWSGVAWFTVTKINWTPTIFVNSPSSPIGYTYLTAANYTWFITVANNLSGGITATCSVSLSYKLDGVCGSRNGTTIYDFDNGGDSLTWWSANLCSNGSVASFSFNSTTHVWSWNCNGANGGNNVSCNATETYCGDGTGWGAEQCDDWNGINTDACSNSCTLNTPSCPAFNFTIAPTTGTVPRPVTGTWSGVAWFTVTKINWTPTIFVNSPSSPIGYTYLTAANYTWFITIANNLSGAITATCSVSLSYKLDGVCGSRNGTTIYDFNNGGDSLTWWSANLCSNGSVASFSFNSTTHVWSWNCNGANGGNNVSCNATETYCGDGTGWGAEQCDDWNGVNTDACSNSCALNTPSCPAFNFTIAPTTWSVPRAVTGSWNTPVTGFTVTKINWTPTVFVNTPSSPIGYTYLTAGNYTWFITVANNLSGAITATCSVSLSYSLDGVCGSKNGSTIYDFNNGGDSLTWWSANLCSNGSVASFSFNSTTHTWSWNCNGANGGSTVSCSTQELYCGDGDIYTGNINNWLVWYRSFDNNDARDDSNNGNSGTLNGGVSFTWGRFWAAAKFDGVDDYISIFPWPTLSGTWDETVSLRIKTNNHLANYMFSAHAGSFNAYYKRFFTDYLNIIDVDNTYYWLYYNKYVRDGVWHHMAYTKSWSNISIYIDGKLEDSDTISAELRVMNGYYIWRACSWDCDPSKVFSWSIDDVRIYNRALSSWDIWYLYNMSEQCDDWNGINTDACSNSCTLNTPSCPAFNFTIAPTTGTVPRPVTGTWSGVAWFTVTKINWTPTIFVNSPGNPIGYTYLTAANYTWFITVANNLSGAITATCSVSLSYKLDGVCGSRNGSTIYDFDNGGDSLTWWSANLCSNGSVASFSFNSTTHVWSWNCNGANGGNNVSCSATETYCGNGSTSNGEQCDDWNGVNTDACSNSCTLNTPSCPAFNFTIAPTTGTVPRPVTGTWSGVAWFTVTKINWTPTIFVNSPGNPIGYTYLTAANYTWFITVANNLSGAITATCSVSLSYKLDGVCGSRNGSTIYDFDNGGDSLTWWSANLCSNGSVASFSFNSTTHVWSWNCNGANGGNNVSCSTQELYCGDGIIHTGNNASNSLVNHWKFDNNTDDTTGNKNGTASGGVSFETGIINSAILLNGIDSSVWLSSSITLWNSGRSMSVRSKTTAWGMRSIFSNKSWWPVSSLFGIYDWKIHFKNYDSSWHDHTWWISVNDWKWHLLTRVNKSDHTMDMYVDWDYATGWFDSYTSNWWPIDIIWAMRWANNRFSWWLDDLRIYNRTLSSGEIQDLYNIYEQCDDGNTNNNDACSNSCTLNTPSCPAFNFTIAPTTWSVPRAVTGSWNTPVTGFTVTKINWTPTVFVNTPSSPIGYTYLTAGNYTWFITVANNLSGAITATCSVSLSYKLDGVCGSKNGSTIYDFDNGGDSLTWWSANLCSNGSVASFSFNSTTHVWSWNCNGANGGSTVSCSTQELYCGDGDMYTGNINNWLVWYRSFDNNDARDDSNNGNSGTLNGGVSFTWGRFWAAAKFDGVDDYISIANESNFDFTWWYTISSYILATWNDTYNAIVTKYNTSWWLSQGRDMIMTNWRIEMCVRWWLSWMCAIGSSDLRDGYRHMVSAVIENNKITLYVDGIIIWSNTWSISPLQNNVPVEIWSRRGGMLFKWSIDDVHIYNRALSSWDIWYLYNMSEQCDDWDGINTDACSNSCTLNTPSCPAFNFTIAPTTWSVPRAVTGSWNSPVTGFTVTKINWTPTIFVNSPSSPIGYTYLTAGNYTWFITVANNLSGAITATCSVSLSYKLDGVCGSRNGSTIYDFNNSGDSLTWWSANLCSNGSVASFSFNSTTHVWSWNCNGANGGNNVSCSTQELYCGDGIISDNITGGLVGYWRLENTGADSSPMGNHGILRNWVAFTWWKIGTWGLFNNNNSYVEIPTTEDLDLDGDTNMSFSAWVKSISWDNWFVLSKPRDNNGLYNYYIKNYNGSITFYVAAKVGSWLTLFWTITQWQWQHIAWVIDKNSIRLYINGNQVSSATNNFTWRTSGNGLPVSIGTIYPYWSWWVGNSWHVVDGSIDDVRIYNRALTSTEVEGLYNMMEICDDGNANNDDACSNSCTLNTPSCPAFNFTIAPTTGTVPRPVTGTWSGVAWFTVTKINWTPTVFVNSPSSPIGYTYLTAGNYTWFITVANNLSGAITATCSVSLSYKLDGVCGAINSGTIYDFNNNWDSLSGGTTGLCTVGTATGFTYNSGTHQWSWSCLGQYGGSNTSCNTQELYCGDGVVNNVSPSTFLISKNHLTNIVGNNTSSNPFISSDGRYISFESNATNLVSWDTNFTTDVFLYDVYLNSLINITKSGNSLSNTASITADTRYVAFASNASNLVPWDSNWQFDVFLYDTQTSGMLNITINGNNTSSNPSVSADGSYLSFQSSASNLVSWDTNWRQDIFLYDIQTSGMLNITINGNNNSSASSISADGRYVAFESTASNLVSWDTNGVGDIFLYDTQTNTLVNITRSGSSASTAATLSADGSYLSFQSSASNLVPGDTNFASDIFLYDIQNNTLINVTQTSNGGSFEPSLSADGSYLSFQSSASNLVSWDTNWLVDIFLYNIQTSEFVNITKSATSSSASSVVSSNGKYVSYVQNNQVYLYMVSTEQCDDGNTNNDDACSNICSYNTPSCNDIDFTITPDNGLVGVTTTGTWIIPGWATATSLDRGIGSPVSNPISPRGFHYLTSSIYTVALTVQNNQSSGASVTCYAVVDVWGNVCINSPTSMSFTGIVVSSSTGVYSGQSDYFDVDDQKGFDSGYYTTLEMSNLSGANGYIIPNTQIQRKASSLDLLSGTVNPNVSIDPLMNNYQIADSSYVFIKRDTTPNMRKKSRYGSKLDLQITISAYTPIDIYNGVITYTLYEN